MYASNNKALKTSGGENWENWRKKQKVHNHSDLDIHLLIISRKSRQKIGKDIEDWTKVSGKLI